MKKITHIFTLFLLGTSLLACKQHDELLKEEPTPEIEQDSVVTKLQLNIEIPTDGQSTATRAIGERITATMDFDVEKQAIVVFYDADGNELDNLGEIVETGSWKNSPPHIVELNPSSEIPSVEGIKTYTSSTHLQGSIPANAQDICVMVNPTAYTYPNVAPATTERPNAYYKYEGMPRPYQVNADDSYIPGKNYLFTIAAARVDQEKLQAAVGYPTEEITPYAITLSSKPLMARIQIINDLENYTEGDPIFGIEPLKDYKGKTFYPTYYSSVSIEAILLNNTMHPERFGNYITGAGFADLRAAIIGNTSYVSPLQDQDGVSLLDRTPESTNPYSNPSMSLVYGSDPYENLDYYGTPNPESYKYAMIQGPRRGDYGMFQFFTLPVGRDGSLVLIDNALNFQHDTYFGSFKGSDLSWYLADTYASEWDESLEQEPDPNTSYVEVYVSSRDNDDPQPRNYPVVESSFTTQLKDAFFQSNPANFPSASPSATIEAGALGFNFWVQGEGTVITEANAVDLQPDLVFYVNVGSTVDLYPEGHEQEGKMILNPHTLRPNYQYPYATYVPGDVIPEGSQVGDYIYVTEQTSYYTTGWNKVYYDATLRKEGNNDGKGTMKLSYKTFQDAAKKFVSFEGGMVYTLKLSDILALILSGELDQYLEPAKELPFVSGGEG